MSSGFPAGLRIVFFFGGGGSLFFTGGELNELCDMRALKLHDPPLEYLKKSSGDI